MGPREHFVFVFPIRPLQTAFLRRSSLPSGGAEYEAAVPPKYPARLVCALSVGRLVEGLVGPVRIDRVQGFLAHLSSPQFSQL